MNMYYSDRYIDFILIWLYVQGKLIEAIDLLILKQSPFIQEVPNATLTRAVIEAIPVDEFTEGFYTLSLPDIERLMHVKVSVDQPVDPTKSLPAESLYSILVSLFKDRRGRVVRACKKAASNVFEQLIKSSREVPTSYSLTSPPKKKKGGFPAPPPSRSANKSFGFPRSLLESNSEDQAMSQQSTSTPVSPQPKVGDQARQRQWVRIVDRGYEEEAEGAVGSLTRPWIVKTWKVECEYFKELFPAYAEKDPGDFEFDFPEHASYVAYYGAVCDEVNVKVPVPTNVGPVLEADTSATHHYVAHIVTDRFGNAIEVSGPCARFEAFVACQA